MAENDDFKPLSVEALTCLLRFGTRSFDTGATPFEVAAWVSQRREAPPGVAALILQKLNDDAVPSDFTPSEVRLLKAVRRYGDTKDEVNRIRRGFFWRVQEWAQENIDLIEGGITQAINDHLSSQIGAVAGLSDAELRRIRATVSSHAHRLAQAFSRQLAQGGEIDVNDTLDAVVDALLAQASPVSALEMLQMIVGGQSRQRLTLSVAEVAAAFVPDKARLLPLAEHLLRAKSLEAQLPEIEQEAETAFEALEAGAAKARWAAAEPSP